MVNMKMGLRFRNTMSLRIYAIHNEDAEHDIIVFFCVGWHPQSGPASVDLVRDQYRIYYILFFYVTFLAGSPISFKAPDRRDSSRGQNSRTGSNK